jgi:hypothetical protein
MDSRLAAILLAMVPALASAQSVTGTVRAATDSAPVPGAVVILISQTGEKLRGTLSGDGGAFRLAIPGAGTYAIRVDVVGYRSVTIPSFAVGVTDSVVRDVRFTFERVTLATSAVRATSSCERVAGETGDAARLWGEARKALEATRLAQEDRRFPVTLTRFERTLSLPDSSVQATRSFEQRGVTQNPFVSLPPDSVAAFGYRRTVGGRDLYYGPDAPVLLSDQFVNAHCFSTRRDGRAGALGLAFRPAASTPHIEIDGVLWLDSATAELRSLEYRYVPALGRNGRGGGTIEFGRLPSGVWGVTRWAIRMPVLRVVESTRRPDGILGRFVDTLVTAVQEEGGAILTGVAVAQSRGSSTRIRGTVYDSTRSRPLAGAVVTLEGAGVTVRSDSTGAFTLDSLRDIGTFRLRFWHARLDSLGIGMPRAVLRVRPGEETVVSVAVPGASAIARERCGQRSDIPVRLVTGLVQGAATAGDTGIEVTVLEQRSGTTGSEPRIRRFSTTTDNGRFAICSLTPGSTAWILARGVDGWTRPVALPSGEDATAIDLSTASVAGGPADSTAQRPTSRVVELARVPIAADDVLVEGWLLFDGEPPPAPVQIAVDGAVASASNAQGFFRIERIADGTRQLTFRAPGMMASHAIDVRRGESVALLATLSPRPVTLAAVRTSAATPAWMRGFEARRRGSQGVFIDREAIDRVKARTLADVLRGVPGVKVEPADLGYRYQSATSNPLTLQSKTPDKADYMGPGGAAIQLSANDRGCDLTVYVDGLLFEVEEGAIDSRINVRDITAIEVYPTASSVPRQFAGPKAACGVLVIWRT